MREDLRKDLLPVITRYGIERVHEEVHRELRAFLHRARVSGIRPEHGRDIQPGGKHSTGKAKKKQSASDYVSKMGVSHAKEVLLLELAGRFEGKKFLPTLGDIRNFRLIYDLGGSEPKSRVSAIPRIFDSIASMTPDNIRKMLEENMFSGPSRLNSIADAIRETGRAATPDSGGVAQTATQSTSTFDRM